jgi:hypothetical protein
VTKPAIRWLALRQPRTIPGMGDDRRPASTDRVLVGV